MRQGFFTYISLKKKLPAAIELGLIDPAKMPGMAGTVFNTLLQNNLFSLCTERTTDWISMGTRAAGATAMASFMVEQSLYHKAGSFARVYCAIAQDSGEILGGESSSERFSSDEIKGELSCERVVWIDATASRYCPD